MINTFTFAGKNSWDDYRLVVEEIPNEEGGEKIVEDIQIPGRTGSLTIDTGAIRNVTRSYKVAFAGKGWITEKMREIRSWLALPGGYQVLRDTYDPKVYRLAKVKSLSDFENIMEHYARGTITFDCDPRRFLVAGSTPITAAGPVNNPGLPSRPRVSLTAASGGTLVIGGTTITITTATTSVILDSEARTIEAGASAVSFADFPVIPDGASVISATGGVSVVSIIPRWWQA